MFMQTHRKQGKWITVEEPHDLYMCSKEVKKKNQTHKNLKLD